MELKSVLNSILEEVNNGTDPNRIRTIAIQRISQSRINSKDKAGMIKTLNNKRSYFEVTKAIYDMLLKYEGDGVINKSLGGYRFR